MNDELETLIDSLGLRQVLNDIAEICEQKADHIASNWQDATLAGEWRRAASWIERAAAKCRV